jgi:hypothetical protein
VEEPLKADTPVYARSGDPDHLEVAMSWRSTTEAEENQ